MDEMVKHAGKEVYDSFGLGWQIAATLAVLSLAVAVGQAIRWYLRRRKRDGRRVS